MDRRLDKAEAMLLAAAKSFEDQLDEVLDVEAGLRDILLEDQYHQMDDQLDDVIDVEAGLAAVLGDGDGDRAGTERTQISWTTYNCDHIIKVTFDPECRVSPQLDTLERVRLLADRMFSTLMEVQLARPSHEQAFAIKREMNQAERRARAFRALPGVIEAKLVDREDAVGIVRSTAEAFMNLHTALKQLHGKSSFPIERVKTEVFKRGVEASRLQEPVARLFDPSDDVVDALL
ncbi:hypothetical protein [Micromonospora sp. NPDC023633]|uniref:hypothetical protein n=1 Tax=Micromonospora sp. NPDC023633 TaxID=3154320 RepID=UPI0033D50014